MEAFLAVVGIIIAFFALAFVSACWSGYVLSILWGWFMVPVFHLPVLSIPTAIGIALVIGYLTKQSTSDLEKKEDHKWYSAFVEAFTKPAVSLLVGWIVKQFL